MQRAVGVLVETYTPPLQRFQRDLNTDLLPVDNWGHVSLLQRGWEKGLPANLSEFQQKRSEEIERVCSRYYAEFLG